MTYYSREITPPRSSREGFCNFVQMIVNDLEAERHHEALMKAVDLLDSISGEANPYKSVTDAEGQKLKTLTDELTAKHQRELAEAISKALADGIAEGRRLAFKSLSTGLLKLMESEEPEQQEPERRPSQEQFGVLAWFQECQGFDWKKKLAFAWETGRYPSSTHANDVAVLQSLRNDFGPSWLEDFQF